MKRSWWSNMFARIGEKSSLLREKMFSTEFWMKELIFDA